MYRMLLAIGLLVISTLGIAAQPDLDVTATNLLQQAGEVAWSSMAKDVVASTHPQTLRVTAIFEKLKQVEDFGNLQLLVADLTAADEPVMVVAEDRVIVQLSFAETHSDNAIAFALSHELGHLRKHHMRERLKTYLSSIEGPIPDIGTLMHTSMSTPAFVAMARQQELEADAFGKSLATRAGFDALAGARETLGDSPADTTHPSGKERISALQ